MDSITTFLAAGEGYSPADFTADLAAGGPAVLGYVGVGVAAGIVVMLALVGIRRGIAAFKSTSK
ncbi:hypothetical protein [Microbacterium sp.]|uniref:hypothetical protein n=1 Tax=Microbacterium sp. TaxID=51671 RepID=UPI0039E49B89